MSTSRLLALCCAATFAFAAPTASALDTSVGVTVGTGAHRDFSDRTCLRETGTRIPRRARVAHYDSHGNRVATSDRRRDCGFGYGRVYTRDDINMTGRVDLGDALRALDPSIR